MYHCYLHGWTSLNGPCPSCVTTTTSSSNSAVIDPIGPYNMPKYYTVASEGVHVQESKYSRWIKEENYQCLVQKLELAKSALEQCCIDDCGISVEFEDRENLESICKFVDELCRSVLSRFDELDSGSK